MIRIPTDERPLTYMPPSFPPDSSDPWPEPQGLSVACGSLTPDATQCPAYLISWPTVPARIPILSSHALRALSPYYASRPWQPLKPLEVQKKLVKPSQENMEGSREAMATHLGPPPA